MKYQKIHREINFSEIAKNIIIWPLQSKEKTKFNILAKEILKNIDFWRSCVYFSICRWWRHHVDWLAVRAPEMMSSPQNHLEHSNILLEIILTNKITCGCTERIILIENFISVFGRSTGFIGGQTPSTLTGIIWRSRYQIWEQQVLKEA